MQHHVSVQLRQLQFLLNPYPWPWCSSPCSACMFCTERMFYESQLLHNKAWGAWSPRHNKRISTENCVHRINVRNEPLQSSLSIFHCFRNHTGKQRYNNVLTGIGTVYRWVCNGGSHPEIACSRHDYTDEPITVLSDLLCAHLSRQIFTAPKEHVITVYFVLARVVCSE